MRQQISVNKAINKGHLMVNVPVFTSIIGIPAFSFYLSNQNIIPKWGIGSEMKKTRPCVIISPNEMNKFLNTIVLAPMTSSSKSYPTRISVDYNKIKGWIVLDQIRTVDRQRIIKVLGNLNETETAKVKAILK